jgi:multidrug efflux pump subunit AcrA (membrane-fusion protein)
MRIFRRVIMPVAWLAVFAVIAVALVKIAFVDGMKSGPSVAGPAAEVTIPVVQATRATVTNTVQVAATIQSDAPAGVRSTAAGKVTHIFMSPGAKVASGDRLYQVRTEVPVGPTAGETGQTTTEL